MSPGISRNLIARITVAAIAIPVILWICYRGGWWLFGMLGLFATIGAIEFLLAEGYRVTRPGFWLGLLSIMVIYAVLAQVAFQADEKLGFWFFALVGYAAALLLIVFVTLLSGMGLSLGSRPPAELFADHTRLLWALVYLGILYGLVFYLGAFESQAVPVSGGDRLLFLFGLLWVGDTAAMWVGSAIGKHKLAPTVSPNKTIEGFLGGIFGALAVGVLMVFWRFSDVAWYHVLIIAFGCSIFGQLGDLVESMWKRSLGIKDSSAIIPGHGGVLDRFDSLLFAAPFMLFYLYMLDQQL